jgi:3-ketoacyl-CoA synthase
LAFVNAVAATAEPEWLGDFRYVKEVIETRAIEILLVCFVVGVGLFYVIRQRYSGHHQCYLLDFACYKPPAERLVNTELSVYLGNNKSMMVTNCLFRVNGYAVLLSNKGKDAARAKMRLLHALRTNVATVDEAYGCVMVKEDDEGLSGVSLSPSLIDVAGDAVKRNMVTLGPKVLPITEQLYYAYNIIYIKALKMNLKPYIPNFRLAFQHFCIHPGGRSVINGIGKSLQLSDYDLEPSRMALHRFGNTSVSGIWYEAAYMEAKRRFKVGDRIWQIGLGSGFKCNSAVWEVMRETHPLEMTVWDDCIHRYPCDTRNNYPDDYLDRWS